MIEFIMLLMFGAAVSVQDVELDKKQAEIVELQSYNWEKIDAICEHECEEYIHGEIHENSYQKGYYAGSKKCKKDTDIIRALKKHIVFTQDLELLE